MEMSADMKSASKLLNQDDFIYYYEKMKNGDMDARNKIIEGNLRLVHYIVYNKLGYNTYDKEELISIGVLGLIKAVDTFDLSKNIQFSTYASKCISNEILQYFRKNNKSLNNVSFEGTFYSNTGDGSTMCYADILEDKTVDIESDYVEKEIASYFVNLIEELPESEKKVIKLYCGFGTKPMLQSEIAKLLGISQPQVSRIISSACRKLKSPNGINPKKTLNDAIISSYFGINGYELMTISDIVLKYNVTYDHVIYVVGQYRKENNVTTKKIKTIYDHLKDYDNDDIDYVISTLSQKDREILRLRYGNDLKNPVCSTDFNQTTAKRFYNVIIPRMKKSLDDLKKGINITDNSEETRARKSSKVQEKKRNSNNESNKAVNMVDDKKSNSNSFTSEDISINSLDFLKIPEFSDLLSILPIKEAIIFALRFGFVDNKNYSIDDIANFFNISRLEVIEICKNALTIYKNKFNSIIDQTIASVSSDSLNLKLKDIAY